jgi:hypothetical protein
MRATHLLSAAFAAIASATLLSSPAKAAVLVVAGTPESEQPEIVGRLHPGVQVELNGGSGFSDVYNVGFGGRLGYTMASGLYLGGNVEHFVGRDVAGTPHNTLLGGEVGLKLFPHYKWELRPYGFAGAEIPSNGTTQLAVAPGFLAAYHFGQGFVDVDARYLATPNPTTFMVLGGGGIAF